MQIKHSEFPDKNDDSEAKLISLGKYAIFAVQLNGYLPLSLVKGKLTMNYTSTPFIQHLRSHLLALLINAGWKVTREQYELWVYGEGYYELVDGSGYLSLRLLSYLRYLE